MAGNETFAVRVRHGTATRPAIIWGTGAVTATFRQLYCDDDGTPATFWGLALRPVAQRIIRGQLWRGIHRKTARRRRNLKALVRVLDEAANDILVYVEDNQYASGILAHEMAHVAQLSLGTHHVDCDALLRHPAAVKARDSLLVGGYKDDPEAIATEIGGYLAQGEYGWTCLDLEPNEARDLAAVYWGLLVERHGAIVYHLRGFGPLIEMAAAAN